MKSLLLVFLLAAFIASCGGAKTGEETKTTGTAAKLGRIDDGARCEAKGRRETLVDLNQDGTADVRKVYLEKDGKNILVCREVDLDFDGVKDLFVFFDEDGQITRDEANLDYTGAAEMVSTYAKGKVIKQEFDTNSDGIVDRLRYMEEGVPVRVEADTDGDQRIDYWEYYEGGKLVRIGQDQDGDGKVDSWSRDDEAAAVEEPKEETEEEGEDAEEKPQEEEG